MSIDEQLNMERDNRRHESTQSRLIGRLKSACCHQGGSDDGMQSVHRVTLTDMADHKIRLLAPWYRHRQSFIDEYLYYPCSRCNRSVVRNRPVTIPNDFVLVPINEVLTAWRIADLSRYDWGENPREMEPDYEMLAAEPEPVLASLVDRESAGL